VNRVSYQGQQAMPNYQRAYICEICGTPQVQWGPGRNRRICPGVKCQKVAKKLRGLHYL
jgi:hypothetical protein